MKKIMFPLFAAAVLFAGSSMAQSQKYVDLSHRMMAVTAWDQDLFQASFTTVYRVLKGRGMMNTYFLVAKPGGVLPPAEYGYNFTI